MRYLFLFMAAFSMQFDSAAQRLDSTFYKSLDLPIFQRKVVNIDIGAPNSDSNLHKDLLLFHELIKALQSNKPIDYVLTGFNPAQAKALELFERTGKKKFLDPFYGNKLPDSLFFILQSSRVDVKIEGWGLTPQYEFAVSLLNVMLHEANKFSNIADLEIIALRDYKLSETSSYTYTSNYYHTPPKGDKELFFELKKYFDADSNAIPAFFGEYAQEAKWILNHDLYVQPENTWFAHAKEELTLQKGEKILTKSDSNYVVIWDNEKEQTVFENMRTKYLVERDNSVFIRVLGNKPKELRKNDKKKIKHSKYEYLIFEGVFDQGPHYYITQKSRSLSRHVLKDVSMDYEGNNEYYGPDDYYYSENDDYYDGDYYDEGGYLLIGHGRYFSDLTTLSSLLEMNELKYETYMYNQGYYNDIGRIGVFYQYGNGITDGSEILKRAFIHEFGMSLGYNLFQSSRIWVEPALNFGMSWNKIQVHAMDPSIQVTNSFTIPTNVEFRNRGLFLEPNLSLIFRANAFVFGAEGGYRINAYSTVWDNGFNERDEAKGLYFNLKIGFVGLE